MRNNSQRGRAQQRVVDLGTKGLRALVNSLIEYARVSGFSTGAGELGSVSTNEDEDVTICEPYGFTSRPPGQATAIVLAPGGETQERVCLGLMAPAGKPETAAGDAIMWTNSGHTIKLENAANGNIIITGKDGGTVTIEATTGAITVNAGTGADVTINVDPLASVFIGDGTAVSLLKAMATQNFLAQAIAFVLIPGNFIPNDGGFKAFQSFLAYITGTPPAPPGGLANAAETQKAKGT